MSKARVLVGTRKGAFILSSDGARKRWDVSGPHFAGWEIYHVAGSPADPDRLYASQSSGWFGQVIQRSNDGGKTWAPVGNKFTYDGVPGTHQWYDGTPHPWEFARVWHLEPSLTDPDTVYAGLREGGVHRSVDGGVVVHPDAASPGIRDRLLGGDGARRPEALAPVRPPLGPGARLGRRPARGVAPRALRRAGPDRERRQRGRAR